MHLKHEKNLYQAWNLSLRWSKKQKGSFLPIPGALARPLLEFAASAVDGEVLKELRKNIWGEGRKRRGRVKRFNYA